MKLAYQAVDARGHLRSDVIEAATREEAIDQLRRQGLFVAQLSELAGGQREEDSPARGGFGLLADYRERMVFAKQMAMLLGAGVGVVPALEAVELQATSPKWRDALRRMRTEVEEGNTLATALASCPGLFDRVFASMVAAGESSATLPEMFRRLATLAQQQYDVRRRFIGALIYPAVLITISIGVVALLLGVVLPRFAGFFEALNVPLPATTRILTNVSEFVRSYWGWVLAGIAATVVALTVYLRTPHARRTLDAISLRLPVIGNLVKHLILARFTRILGVLLASRISLLEALELATASIRHHAFRELLDEVYEAVSEGQPVADALRGSPLVPPSVVQAVAAGEQSGNIGSALLFVADCLDEDNAARIATLSKILEPLVLLVMGLIVGLVAFSLFVPMFDIATAAGGP